MRTITLFACLLTTSCLPDTEYIGSATDTSSASDTAAPPDTRVDPARDFGPSDPLPRDAVPDGPASVPHDYSVTVMGRYWVAPNPIIIPAWADPTYVGVHHSHVGTEGLVIDNITIEGSSVLSLPWGLIYPIIYEDLPDDYCGEGGLIHNGLDYHPSSTPFETAYFVVHTSDPTSPTLRVPIFMDWTGTYAYCSYFTEASGQPRLGVGPNPIRISRLPTGESTTKEICIGPPWEVLPFIRLINVDGPGLAITGARVFDGLDDWVPISLPVMNHHLDIDGLLIDLTYTSEAETDVDGILSITFVGSCSFENTLQVPIIIR